MYSSLFLRQEDAIIVDAAVVFSVTTARINQRRKLIPVCLKEKSLPYVCEAANKSRNYFCLGGDYKRVYVSIS